MTVDTTADHDSAVALLESRFAETVVALPCGVQVAVRTAGPPTAGDAARSGPVFVLLHGIGSGAASWLHVALRIGREARVVAWDAPGYGASTPLVSETPLAGAYAERLGALLKAMRIERCILVGHSLGALIAAAFAAGPGAAVVQRLVLISPARGYGAPGLDARRQEVLDGRLRNLRERGIAGMAAEAPGRLLTAAADAGARDWVRWNAGRLDPAGYVQAVQMLCRDDIERYRPLAMPVEVHVGDADAVTPPNAGREVAQAFGAPFDCIDGAGHASPVERPHAVADRLLAAAAALRERIA